MRLGPAAAGTLLATALALGGCARPGPPPPTPPGEDPSREADRSERPAPRLLGPGGAGASVADIVRAAADVDVVFVGELHGNPDVHDFQLRLLDALLEYAGRAGREVVLSMEMFETDVQLVLDEYLGGLITEPQFQAAARPWANYERDYRPLVERAREAGIRVVAANAPRRYVNRVGRLGRDGLQDLSAEARAFLPPLPYPEPSEAYRAGWDRRMEAMAHHGHGHGGESALQAQALWDASMAYRIHRALEGNGEHDARPPTADPPAPGGGVLVLHLSGSFHVENQTGIPEALRHYRPEARTLVVTTRTDGDPSDPEDLPGALADFVLLTAPAS